MFADGRLNISGFNSRPPGKGAQGNVARAWARLWQTFGDAQAEERFWEVQSKATPDLKAIANRVDAEYRFDLGPAREELPGPADIADPRAEATAALCRWYAEYRAGPGDGGDAPPGDAPSHGRGAVPFLGSSSGDGRW